MGRAHEEKQEDIKIYFNSSLNAQKVKSDIGKDSLKSDNTQCWPECGEVGGVDGHYGVSIIFESLITSIYTLKQP